MFVPLLKTLPSQSTNAPFYPWICLEFFYGNGALAWLKYGNGANLKKEGKHAVRNQIGAELQMALCQKKLNA